MTDGHCCVAADKQQRGRHSNYIGTSKHHRIGAFDWNSCFIKQINATIRCAWDEQRLASLLSQPPNVDRRETIYIFFYADELQNTFFIKMRRQRQLNQDAVHRFIIVQTFDQLFQFSLRNIRGEMMTDRTHAEFFACFAFRLYISRRVDAVADQNGCQRRSGFSSCDELSHGGGYSIAHFLRNQFSIYQLSCHVFSSSSL